jgi:putative NADH-flavin reductase
VDAAIEGKDAVISAVGTDLGQTNLRHKAMENIISAMQKHHVKRVIGIGGMGVLQASETLQIFETKGFPAEYIPVSQDHNSAYHSLLKSGLDFTFVCPPMIQEGVKTGNYITEAEYPPKGEFHISTGDLADFMIQELLDPKFIGERVGIAST